MTATTANGKAEKDKGAAVVHEVGPTAVYTLDGAREALRLTDNTLRREVRLGRLRVSKRAGRYYVLGEWLLDWFRGGEVRREGRADGGRGREVAATAD